MQGGGPWITWGPRVQAISHSDICDEAKLTSWALILPGLTWQAAAGQTKPHCWSSDPAGWLDKPGSGIESLESNCYLVCSLNCRILFYKCGPFFFGSDLSNWHTDSDCYARRTHPGLCCEFDNVSGSPLCSSLLCLVDNLFVLVLSHLLTPGSSLSQEC